MSTQSSDESEAEFRRKPCDAVELVIKPGQKDLGDGFTVRRAIPNIEMRSVGPWIFFDHFGPVNFEPGKGMDVRPHPHINLATVTYLFEGEILHQDSIGSYKTIKPGAINLMVAGRGIVHSERTDKFLREDGHTLHGLQLWMALPEKDEEAKPTFHHYTKDSLPVVRSNGSIIRVMMGKGYGVTSPVKTFSNTFYGEVIMEAGKGVGVPDSLDEGAVYVIDGQVEIDGTTINEGHMAILNKRPRTIIAAREDSRLVILGGTPLGKRHMWWNFVSSKPKRIEKAKQDWANGNFSNVPGDDEFIPLPKS